MSMLDVLNLPRVIYRTDSEYNGQIEVLEEGNIRRIKVEGATQSISWDAKITQKMYWGKSIELLKKHSPHIENIMILGMAGGTLAHLISRSFPGITIADVEIDPIMIDLAREYFDVDSIPNHHIYNEDALAIIAHPDRVGVEKNSFDACFVDIYCGKTYPDLGTTGTFFAGIKHILKPGGLVIFNRLYISEFRDDVDAFLAKIEEQFEDVVSEVAPGRDSRTNMLIVGRSSE